MSWDVKVPGNSREGSEIFNMKVRNFTRKFGNPLEKALLVICVNVGSWPLLVKRIIDELFCPNEQAQSLRQTKQISSSFIKIGHDPFYTPEVAKL
jgi:hypothetical protein